MLQTNKTFEVYAYEDPSAQTEINFQNEIILKQSDINDIQIFYRQGIIIIEGFVRHGDKKNSDNILKLNKWARVNGEQKDWLKKTNIKIARNGFVVRELLLNTFIVDYYECFKKGQHRFHIILRSYKYARLDGVRGETGTNETESYVKSMTIKNVQTTMVITSFDYETAFYSGLNLVTIGTFVKRLFDGFTGSKRLAFFIIAHGTGVISEFCADVKFTITGESEKMGSYNITRDEFYKPLGKIIATNLNKYNPNLNISENIGEESYNQAQLVYSWLNIGDSIIKGTSNLYKNKGLNILYTMKLKNVKVSKFGRQIMPQKVIGATPFITLKNIIKEIITDIYPAAKSTKKEIKKQGEK